jgi:tetratricopeptide (TPR) repeat protein
MDSQLSKTKTSISIFMRSRFFALQLAFFVLFLAAPHLSAQTDGEQRKLRLAESYEQSGDVRSAGRIYQELYDANKRLPAYFDGVVRTLLALNQTAALLPLVDEQLQLLTPNPALPLRPTELLTLKGDLLWRTGKTSQAEEAWKQAVRQAPAQQQAFALIARSEAQNRAFDLAIQTLLEARSRLSAPTLFSEDLSQLYGAVGNYTAGAQETMTFLRQSNNLNVAQGRIAAYLVNQKGIQQSRDVLQAAAAADQNNFTVQRVYAWFLRETKDYNRALGVTEHIDNMLNAQGREILMFAEKARQERFYDAALKAYGMVIDKGKRSSNALSAFYGYARTMESRLQEAQDAKDANDSTKAISQQDLNTIVERYRSLIADFPNTQYAAEAQYRIARLMLDNLNRPDQAEIEFTRLVGLYTLFPIAARGSVDLGNLYVQQNRLDKAAVTYRTTIQTFARQRAEADEAAFHLAELEYFAGELDSAQEHFSRLASNSNADIANDALERLALLDTRRTPEGASALAALAKAELLERRQDWNAAIEAYTALATGVVATAPHSVIGEQGLLRAGKILMMQKRYTDAEKRFTDLLVQFPEGVNGDYAMMYHADALAREGRKDEAIQMYSQVLARFPRSTLLQEVRLKIRKLRGDA